MNPKYLILIALLMAGVSGCEKSKIDQADVLVKTGSKTLTRQQVEIMAGLPYDSLTNEERWGLINHWIENAVILQEGERRGLDEEAAIESRLDEIRAELYFSNLLYEMEEITPSDSVVDAYYEEHKAEFVQTSDSYLLGLYRADSCDVLTSFIAEFTPEDEDGTDAVFLEQRWLARTDQMNGFLQTLLVGLTGGDWTEVQQDPDGCRALRVVKTYSAGEVLDIEGARDEIEMQLTIDSNNRQRDELMSELRRRYPVTIFVEDSL